jgi:hypothetical protein
MRAVAEWCAVRAARWILAALANWQYFFLASRRRGLYIHPWSEFAGD